MVELLLIAVCIAANGALSALEAAFVSASRLDLLSGTLAGDARVERFLRLRQKPESVLSVIQVGITLVGIASGALGGVLAQRSLAPWLHSAGLGPGMAQTAALIVVSLPLVLVTVILGELVPKVFALRHAAPLALVGVRYLGLMARVLSPVVRLLAWVTRLIVSAIPPRLFVRGQPPPGAGPAPSFYALNLLDLSRHRVRDAMLAWTATISVDAAMPCDAVVRLALSSGHTRLPVVEHDRVIGVLHTKELLRFVAAGQHDWRSIVRLPIAAGPEAHLLKVLRQLQAGRSHMAVVQAPDGRPLGIITLEDILEEVFGEIYDEDDDQAVVRLLASRQKAKPIAVPESVRP